MYTKAVVTAATVFAALLPSVLAAGTARVKNNCQFPVYLWSIANDANVQRHTINPGGTYEEKYRTNPNSGGISLKVSKTTSDAVITQLEYTLKGPKVFYDISHINGHPFLDEGVSLSTSANCPTVNCPPGVKHCDGAYNQPNDLGTLACSASADVTMTVCSAGKQQSRQLNQQPSPPPTPQQDRPHHWHPRQFSV